MGLDQFSNLNTPVLRKTMSPEQESARRLAAKIGHRIQLDFPQIAKDYPKLSMSALVTKYRIIEKYNLANHSMARIAVSNAINGAQIDGVPYKGLIEDVTLAKRIGTEHMRQGGRKTGEVTKMKGTGIFGMTPKEKEEASSKGGNSLSFEQRSELGKHVAIVRGNEVLSSDTESFIRQLDLSKYLLAGGRIDLKRIAQEIDKRFNGSKKATNTKTVGSFLERMRRQIPPIS